MQLPPLVDPTATLGKEEISRYSRHLLIPDVGLDGQRRLKSARVLVIGAGGLGSPTLLYLAAAGVGTLGIIDFDVVDESNLQRQVIHKVSTVGQLKVESAAAAIRELNPYVNLELHTDRLEAEMAVQLFSQYDLILDGTDNFATRYLVNDACVLAGKPYVWGSIFRFEGQVSVFWEDAPRGAGLNYRDLYPEPPPPELAPSCSEGGVLGILCASIGSIMATEAVKLITGIGEPLLGRLMVYDALDMTYRQIALRRAPDRRPITELSDYQAFCGLNRPLGVQESDIPSISAVELKALRERGAHYEVIDVRERTEWDIVHIDGAHHMPKSSSIATEIEACFGKDTPLILHCKSGLRSKAVLLDLQRLGFSDVRNLEGGILAWIRDVDATLPSY
ncbi:molybdopterin-synthase adenylyltransferase MoeB [Halomonas pacifica]|uniref:Molybdopterin-synthase adenylyltransferase n=1 Tax=Bisbaumannia pacifica TaxID=77098 RepID=A0ABD4KZ34_9GAMM|nr:molybdopterin-synthase adenylyltransferase MoeB [Halomonas pacifica]MBH8578647.1 molybdopterin-synthase adenylyltransferase MoeB [Halomonas pacifica]MDC8803761.1 molybdopterin-synthase adenylyltransferase MoeB [Halomonas pacifica]